MSQFNQSPQRGFGFQQYLNFGKHKGKTYYDIANAGDYKYLNWCSSNDYLNAKDPRSFFISDTCLPHINAAMRTQSIKSTPWTKVFSEPDENGKIILNFTAMNEETQEQISSPDIEMKKCLGCGMVKSYILFNLGNHDLCRKCYCTPDQPKKYIPEVENKKGNKETYRSQRPQPYRKVSENYTK